MDFTDYSMKARDRGAMGFEVFQVTTLIADGSKIAEVMPDHLAYQAKLEAEGKLLLAGPISDTEGGQIIGGSIILKAADMAEAVALAEADPMHASGARKYELRRWLINEGGFNVRFGFSTGPARLV